MIDAAPHPALLLGPRNRRAPGAAVSDADVVKAWKSMAGIISRLGETEGAKYLPIYERLEAEVEKINTRSAAMARALQVASQQ